MMQEIMQFISRHPILSLAWTALLIALIILIFNGLFTKTKNITSSQAIQLINKEEAITIDLRSCDDFRKGHIIDSINLTPSEIKCNNIRELKKHKQKPIIVVSANGMEASKPAEQLLQYGFKRVFILKEGINGWSSKNLPLARSKK
ncbi:MAG: rhodanese-like domain-containing protein [Arsenophonus sp. NEOnobi-MAG3]